MATGGNHSRSLIGASDAWYEFTCTPCEKDGKNCEAEYLCIECQSYFCKKCVDFHNKFLGLHTLLDKTAMKSIKMTRPGQTPSSTLPGIPCTDHPGKMIEMYCGQHDEVCCIVCIAVKHRSCDGVEFIPTVVKGINTVSERQQANRALESIRKRLQQCLTRKKTKLSDANKEYNNCMKDIKALKTHLIDRINELEQKSIDLAKDRHKHTTDSIHSDISAIDDVLKMIDGHIDRVNNISNDEETELFIHIKQSRLKEIKGNEFLDTIKRKVDTSLTYKMKTEIESVLADMETLVVVKEEVNSDVAYTATLLDSFSDNGNSVIYGCCSLDDNQILITDYYNNKVKRIDSTFKIKDDIDILGKPYGICKTGDSEVAVSLRDAKRVQFVSVGKHLSRTSSFDVGAKFRGMSYSQDRLYICCDGCVGQGPAQLKIYDKSGNVVHVIQNDNSGECLFSCPRDIYVNPQSSQIYIADEKKGIISINAKTNQSFSVGATDIKDPINITADDHGNMFVCGYSSQTVVQIDRHGKVLGTILTQTDGIKRPLSLLYLNNPSRLVVCVFGSDKINVFKLS